MTEERSEQIIAENSPLILVADDDITIRTLARVSLEEAGFRVEEATNGVEALFAFDSLPLDLVLLDVMMPEMDGFEVCDRIRHLPRGEHIPILMLTGLDDRASINRAYETGATDFATKPINWVILGHRVQYVLRASQNFNALCHSEAKNRAILEAIPDLMFQITREGRFTDFSKGKTIDFPFRSDEFLNRRLEEVFPDALAQKTMEAVDRSFLTGGVQEFEYQLMHKDELRYYEARIVACGENEILAMIRDLTADKRAQEERIKIEAQLQQVQKLKAIGTLSGGIAHDFNNLLMGIQGRAQLMLFNSDPDNPHYDSLKSIESIVKKGAGLTRQLLGFAKEGKYEVKPTDLSQLVEESAEMFGRTKKEIRIHIQHQEGLWPAEVDRGQIEQVLLNLYVNAWQAMPDGGELYLETANLTIDETCVKTLQVKPGQYVRISVTDTGVGMDEETKQRIFEPFFSTKELGRGTGLGLASAYGIIRNHHGLITVYSEKNRGTTFNIYLPASEKEIAAEEIHPEKILRGKETVLLVDDEDMVVEVGRPMLEFLGYQVLVARGGKQAVKMYEGNEMAVAIVLLDMIMPDLSGKETFERLRAINSDIKVLLVSGYSMNGQAIEMIRHGCKGFIQKPFTLSQISQRIRKALDQTD